MPTLTEKQVLGILGCMAGLLMSFVFAYMCHWVPEESMLEAISGFSAIASFIAAIVSPLMGFGVFDDK